MPVTPFHLGPGIAFKSIASRHVSFTIFAFTQIVIDIEALFYFAQNEGHMHRYLHTFLAAAIVAAVCAVIGRPICQWLLKKWNSHLSFKQEQWLYVEPHISLRAAIWGVRLWEPSAM
jgi:ABC-type spermidine/putrescine transport system permease subunit I